MKFIRCLFILAFSALFAPSSLCQNSAKSPWIPRFLARDPDKLTYRLTHDITSDSEKVRVIHNWIASNIRYDVKKWLSYNYSKAAIKGVLRRRKAICVGYSELFQYMCTSAGITCIAVPGYAKTTEVNLNDHTYLDEHIWNAVYLDGTWKLVDVCWDAGGIKITKRTFRGFFVHLFSGGKRDQVKYSPHFVKGCSGFYCMRNGSYFSTDHLPLNPIWQLLYPVKTISQFEHDSAYYYKRYSDTSMRVVNNPEFEDKRRQYLAMNDFDRDIEDGMAGYAFNRRNHYAPTISYYDLSAKAMQATQSFVDTAVIIRLCDTALSYLTTAIRHLDTAGRYTQTQKTELTANNQKKKSILTKQNTKLITETSTMLNQFTTSRSFAKTKGRYLYKNAISRSNALITAKKNNSVLISRHGSGKPEDSIECITLIKELKDSISREEEQLRISYERVDSMYDAAKTNIEKYAKQEALIMHLEEFSTAVRFGAFDDLDYEVRRPKDTLILLKYPNDSLICNKNKTILSPLFAKFTEIIKQDKLLQKNYTKQLQQIKKLSSYCSTNIYVQEILNETIDDLKKEFNKLNTSDEAYSSNFLSVSSALNTLSKASSIENAAYKLEKQNEQVFYKIRKNYIDGHSKGLASTIKSSRNKLLTDKKTIAKYIKTLRRKRKKNKVAIDRFKK